MTAQGGNLPEPFSKACSPVPHWVPWATALVWTVPPHGLPPAQRPYQPHGLPPADRTRKKKKNKRQKRAREKQKRMRAPKGRPPTPSATRASARSAGNWFPGKEGTETGGGAAERASSTPSATRAFARSAGIRPFPLALPLPLSSATALAELRLAKDAPPPGVSRPAHMPWDGLQYTSPGLSPEATPRKIVATAAWASSAAAVRACR